MEKDTLTINIETILLIIGILIIIFGIVVWTEILFYTLWIKGEWGFPIIALGSCFIWGYITSQILPDKKGAFGIGFLLGLIGVVIAICIRPTINNKLEEE